MSRIPLILTLVLALVLMIPFPLAQAATPAVMTLEPSIVTYQVGDTISLPLKINTSGDGIYSIQADISFPADKLQVTGIDTTSSVFPLQVINSYSGGSLSIIRGSFSPVNTPAGLIATIQMKALKAGAAELVFDPTSVALNQTGTNQSNAFGVTLTINSMVPSPSPIPIPSPSLVSSPSVIPSPSPSPVPSVLPSPAPSKSTIIIYAAGTPADGVYPTLALQIRNARNNWKTVKTFTNVMSLLNQLQYTHTTLVKPQDIRIRFTNDRYLPKKGQDRNLYIDKINLDGIVIETERETTFSTGTWSSQNGCGDGFKRSEWLHCNG